eukprot:3083632-Rhodomonas_salina.1
MAWDFLWPPNLHAFLLSSWLSSYPPSLSALLAVSAGGEQCWTRSCSSGNDDRSGHGVHTGEAAAALTENLKVPPQ